MVHLAGTETITGVKNFDIGLTLRDGYYPTPANGYIGLASNGSGLTILTKPSATVYNHNLQFQASSNDYNFPAITGVMAMLEGTQTFSGGKTFSGSASFNSSLGNSPIFSYGAAFVKGNTPSATSASWSQIYSASGDNNIVIADDINTSKLQFQAASSYTYTFPSASGNLVLGSGSADQVAYWNSASGLTYDSTFYYSSSNKRLGVNTNTPNATIGSNIGIDSGFGLLVKNADNNYNGLGIGIDSSYGNLISSVKIGTAATRNITVLNQTGYHSLTEAGNFGLNILTPTASPSGVGSLGIDVYGGSNAAGIGFHNAASGVGNTNGAYIYLTTGLGFTLRNLEGGITSSSLGDFSVITNSTENFRVNASDGSLWQSNITSSLLKTNSGGVIVAAVANTDYQAPITLNTSGSSGAATFTSNVLNIPNYTLSGLGGVPTSRTLTINGTAYDLSADRSWSVGTLTGGGADGRVAFWNGATNVVSDSLFVWDDTNNRLGIGLNNPQRSLEIYTTSPDTHLRLSGAAPSVSMGEAITGSIYQAKFGLATANNQFVTGSVAGDFVINNQTGSTIWAYNSVERMRLDTNGNLGVGGIANSSYRLHVFGTAPMLGIESTTTGNVYLRMLQAGTVVGGMYYNNSDSTLRINNNNGGLRFDTSTVNGALSIASTGIATFTSTITPLIIRGTNVATMWTEYYYNTSTLSGYIGSGDGLLSGANASDFIVRSQADFVVATGGNNRRLTIASTGAATFSSSVTANGLRLNGGDTTNTIYAGSASMGITAEAGYNISIGRVSDTTKALNVNTTNGNVGIGTSSPNATLSLYGASTAYMNFRNSTNQSSNFGFVIEATGNESELWNYANGYMRFGTNNAERMRITSGGNVCIGQSSVTSSSYIMNITGNAGIWLKCSYVGDAAYLSQGAVGYHFYAINNSGTNTFYVANNGDVRNSNNSYGAISDISLKENITDATPKLEDLLKVRIRNYNLKSDESKTKQIGVIAQELEEIFPNMISNDKQMGSDETIKTVKYSVFVPMLIKAIQEQQQQIEELKALINK